MFLPTLLKMWKSTLLNMNSRICDLQRNRYLPFDLRKEKAMKAFNEKHQFEMEKKGLF